MHTEVMADASVFSILPSNWRLGAVLESRAPGITLYLADLQLGRQATKVRLTWLLIAQFYGQPQLLYIMQVAVKRLSTSSAPPAAVATFLKEVQMLQLASATCQRACHMLGCCKLGGDACIVMSLYPKSATKRLEESQGSPTDLAPGFEPRHRCHGVPCVTWFMHEHVRAHIQDDVVMS